MSVISAPPIRPYVSFLPSHVPDLFSVRYNGKRYELSDWQKAAIVITAVAGVLLAGVGVLLGFYLSEHFRNQMVDRWMQQPVNPEAATPFYFEADYFDGTDRETAAPVGAGEMFYQQKQISSFCSIHSLCNFAGRNVEDFVPTMIKANNVYWENCFRDKPNGEACLEMMKDEGQYIQSLQSIEDHDGIPSPALTLYMNENKAKLHLPEACRIQSINGLIESQEIQDAMHTVETDPSLHRVIVSFSNNRYGHFVAIRKDATGQWRVLDSMQSIFHTKKQLQPCFPTIQEAIQNLLKRHHAQGKNFEFIYPTQDIINIPSQT